MNPQRNLRFVEFAQRSLVNYRVVLAQPSSAGRYEVTALLTALVSIFVWTKEEYFTGRGDDLTIRWRELGEQFAANNRTVPRAAQRSPTYPHFLVNLRHGIAHGNIDLGTDAEVKDVTIWNTYGATQWCATLPLQVLEQVARDTVFDLNAAAVATFGGIAISPLTRDTPCSHCNCGFEWIGDAFPKTCPYCATIPPWHPTGWLDSRKVDAWSILRVPPTYCFGE